MMEQEKASLSAAKDEFVHQVSDISVSELCACVCARLCLCV